MPSIIDRVKSKFPTSSNPEPEANISAEDFTDTQEDVESGDGEDNDNTRGDAGGEQSNAQQTGGDGQEQPENRDGGVNGGTGGSDSDVDSDGGEQPQNGDGDGSGNTQQNPDGDGNKAQPSEPGNAGENSDGDSNGEPSTDGQSEPGNGHGNDGESDTGDDAQNSLFDYEDLEKLGEGDNNENPQSGNEEQTNGNESESGENVDGEGTNEDGDGESVDGDGNSDSDESESDHDEDLGNEKPGQGDSKSGTDDEGTGETEDEAGDDDGGMPGESDGDSDGDDIDNGSEFPEDADSEDGSEDGEQPSDESQPGRKEFEPDNDGRERTDSEPFEPHPGMIEQEQEHIENEKEDLEKNIEGLEQEMEKMQNALENELSSDQAGGGSIDRVKMNTNPKTRTDDPRWQECKNEKKRVAQLLRQRLERSRRDSYRRGKKAGMLDGMNLHKVATNQLDAFKQFSPGDDKEYALIISVDRSGSMGTTDMDIAERAMTQFALAMEDIGVDVCIIEMLNTEARVVLPFNVDVNTVKGDLLTGDTGGRTPLTDVIQIAKKRMKYSQKFPILLSITDGSPDSPEKYLNEIEGCNMPVMGLTVGRSGGQISDDADRYYDVHRGVSTVDELTDEMEKMIMKITF